MRKVNVKRLKVFKKLENVQEMDQSEENGND